MANHHEAVQASDPTLSSSNRSFGIVFAVVFSIIGAWPTFQFSWPILTGGYPRLWAIGIAGGFLVIALIYPKILTVPNRLWFKFGILLSKVVNPIIMGLIFFAMFTPIGIFMRLFGRDALKLKMDPKLPSYWNERKPAGPEPKTLKHQF